jgi:hypothetical protein
MSPTSYFLWFVDLAVTSSGNSSCHPSCYYFFLCPCSSSCLALTQINKSHSHMSYKFNLVTRITCDQSWFSLSKLPFEKCVDPCKKLSIEFGLWSTAHKSYFLAWLINWFVSASQGLFKWSLSNFVVLFYNLDLVVSKQCCKSPHTLAYAVVSTVHV